MSTAVFKLWYQFASTRSLVAVGVSVYRACDVNSAIIFMVGWNDVITFELYSLHSIVELKTSLSKKLVHFQLLLLVDYVYFVAIGLVT